MLLGSRALIPLFTSFMHRRLQRGDYFSFPGVKTLIYVTLYLFLLQLKKKNCLLRKEIFFGVENLIMQQKYKKF